MSPWIAAVLMSLAAARLLRLFVQDTLIQRQRDRLLQSLLNRNHDKLYELATCPWCLSAWISAGVVLITWIWVPLPLPILVWLGVWYASLLFYWLTEALSRYANLDD